MARACGPLIGFCRKDRTHRLPVENRGRNTRRFGRKQPSHSSSVSRHRCNRQIARSRAHAVRVHSQWPADAGYRRYISEAAGEGLGSSSPNHFSSTPRAGRRHQCWTFVQTFSPDCRSRHESSVCGMEFPRPAVGNPASRSYSPIAGCCKRAGTGREQMLPKMVHALKVGPWGRTGRKRGRRDRAMSTVQHEDQDCDGTRCLPGSFVEISPSLNSYVLYVCVKAVPCPELPDFRFANWQGVALSSPARYRRSQMSRAVHVGDMAGMCESSRRVRMTQLDSRSCSQCGPESMPPGPERRELWWLGTGGECRHWQSHQR